MTDMSPYETEQARLASRELWLHSDAYYREHYNEISDAYQDGVCTPGGIRIEKDGDLLTVRSDYPYMVGGVTCEFTIAVEYGWDIRELPIIIRIWPDGLALVPQNRYEAVTNGHAF